MLTFVMLALRNLRRNRSRTALTLSAVFAGVAMTIVLSAFGNGLGVLLATEVVKAKVGAIQIHRKGYAADRDNQPLKLDMPESGDLQRKIADVPGVVSVAPRLVFAGLISNGRASTMAVVRGIDPARDYQVLPWSTHGVEGATLDREPRKDNGAVVGAELGRSLDVVFGKTSLTLQASTQAGQQNALDLEPVGSIDNGNAFESKRLLDVPLAFAQSLLRMPGRITEWVVRVDDLEAIDSVAAALTRTLGADYEVETWRELRPNISDVIGFQQIVVGVVSVVFLVIVVFGVINTMAMSVFERTREIGTMLALGVRRRQVSGLFLLEAAILALSGAGLGAVVAKSVVTLVTLRGGIRMSAIGSTVERLSLVPVIPAGTVSNAIMGATLGALVAALYPAWKAARLRPVDALRAI